MIPTTPNTLGNPPQILKTMTIEQLWLLRTFINEEIADRYETATGKTLVKV